MANVTKVKPEAFSKKAKKHHADGKLNKAVSLYMKATMSSSDNYDTISRMTRCLSFQKKFKLALDAHLFLAVKYPQYHQGDSFYILKNDLRTHINKKKNYKLCQYAIDILEKIAQLLHNKTKVYDVLSDLYWCIGEKDKAVKTKSLASREFALRAKNSLQELENSETIAHGCLPNFMVIGPQKTGTTALYSFLIKHPDIYSSIQKEIFYFNTDLYNNGIDWYQSHFPVFSNKKYLTGEATAKYFNSLIAAQRIGKDLPLLKIIFILRDPAARAISDYYMKVRNGLEKRSLSDAIASEIKILQNYDDAELVNVSNQELPIPKRYVHSGLYYFFLKEYISQFASEQFLILESSNLKNNCDRVLQEVFTFLGVDNYSKVQNKASQQVNVGVYSKKDKLYQDTYQKLTDFYQPYNKMLQELTEIKFPWL